MQNIKYHSFRSIVSLACMICSVAAYAQSAKLSGKITDEGTALAYASVFLSGTQLGVYTDADGIYIMEDIPAGVYQIEVNYVGYMPKTESITVKDGETLVKNFELQRDVLSLSQVVVTGTRNQVKRYNSPVIVNTIDNKIYEVTQALNVADGLNFSPGLRIENNCQNCGFTQLRMNGLDGPYSQILINSRPVFSALAGVYGLEMLPSNMVDRIEVVRGGGSVMYGGNAIAGTVNIITKDPFKNTFEVGMNQSFIKGKTPDRTVNFNGSLVSEDFNKGITFFGFNRNRDPWDANADGFSEIVKLHNNTFGFDAFYKFSDFNKLKLGAYYINEFRRGGNKFDLFPHQTDVTEQLNHNILSANLSYEHMSKDEKHQIKSYGSVQHVDRSSYYGGGGRVIAEGDSLTAADVLAINAYGESEDISTVAGLQYSFHYQPNVSLTIGSEYVYNEVKDEMPGYGRVIDQEVATWGSFAELELKPIEKLTLLLGGRFDQLYILGRYDLAGEKFNNDQDLNIFVPRLSAMYSFKKNLKLRASFAQGYRGPQAFDEDLHIETVGGAALFTRISPDLEVERSNSSVLSLNYDHYIGEKQMNFVLEGFYTKLENPFISADQEELPSGVAVVNKRNGDGATVAGINVEANIALSNNLVIQSGATIQSATYDVEEEIWAPEESSSNIPATRTKSLLRTPNAYGYFSVLYNPIKPLAVSYSGVITGSMDVPHVIDPDTERSIIKSTPTFFENNIKLAYTFQPRSDYHLELFGGMQNIFDSYQDDFDKGADRDAGYVYGPLRPRTFYLGVKFGLD